MNRMMDALRELLTGRGAAWVGCGDLTVLPEDVREGLPRGVCIAVALDPEPLRGITDGPTLEYYAEYHRANDLLDVLAEGAAHFLREQGARAVPRAATNVGIDFATHSTRLPHKTVATRGGLGWVGKCALLVTEQLGSALRLTAVLTDADLPTGDPVTESRCGDCVACVEVCPGGAPSGREWEAGMPREAFFDAHACRRGARARAARAGIEETICGMCIAACPWTQAYLRAR